MILTIEQISEILKENPNKNMMDLAKERNRRLSVHLYGTGMRAYMGQINSFENEDQYAVRERYARSNRDIMSRITRPIDKVFSAKGGSTYYNLPDNKEQEFRSRLLNAENGLSLRKWIEQYWKQAYLSDPMGLVFMEIDNKGDAYPTYKGVSDIYTYEPDGRRLECLFLMEKGLNGVNLFQNNKNHERYRVVDDVNDMIVEWDGKNASVISTVPNYFGFVPGIINSDIPILNTLYFESPLWEIVEIADEYLRECSVKSVYKLLHGFPKSWKYAMPCPNCRGSGNIEAEPCKACNGTGVRLKSDVADTLVLPLPDTRDDVVIAPNVAGYIAPPLDTWERMSAELQLLENIMFETLWGTQRADDGDNNTATGKFIDTQPVNDRLSKISDAAEVVERFVTDCMGKLYYGDLYNGSSINYGRRFSIEAPDTILEKYINARREGAPDTVLDDLLREHLQAKYENNSMEMRRQLKSLELEPFPHLTSAQVQNLNVGALDYIKKVYYSDFLKTISEHEIIFSAIEELQRKFDVYAEEKQKIINISNNNNNLKDNEKASSD